MKTVKIIVVGHGKWGTAMASLLSENKREFSFWMRGKELPDNSILVMCVPTQAIRDVLGIYGKNLKKNIIVNGAKGVEKETHKLPYQITQDVLGKDIEYFSLMGPSFADEIVRKMPTLVNVGYVKEKNAEFIRDLFQTDYFRIRLTRGVRALELACAFKNVYAIACGIAYGLGFETNTRVKLMLLAIEEFYALSKRLGYKIDGRALPGTIGDLILTCSSEESRNFSFGKLLAKYKVEESLRIVKETVEGYATAESVPYFEKKTGVELPLAHFVYKITEENNPVLVKKLFSDFVKTA